jgi:hypothetical protein
MPKEVSQMIKDLMKILEAELGHSLPQDLQHRAEAQLCQQYGGERVYVPKLPKLVKRVQFASLSTGTSACPEVAAKMGITVRGLRKSLRGR